MNPFKNRKKGKDDSSAPRPSVESDSSGPFRMFGRKKSQEDSGKPELDLTTALPSNDEFRTSLLMTGLSARFSMLREQDDPNTKVGKASDDSVLFPKRQSKMADFGFGNPLQDIAEVESLRAPYSRVDSFHSSDDGASVGTSIMNRGKPIEGNTLFGGKQRIYKIAAGSKSGSLARPVLYDDEVSQSAFQKWRQAEKEKENLNSDHASENQDQDAAATMESEDQPTEVFESYLPIDRDRRRETNSTTSSGPSAARNSTAATSITSTQPNSSLKDWQTNTAVNSSTLTSGPERSVTRTRRLYEQGLNQDLHEQQSSALSRIDTLTRQRVFGSRTPDLSPMANSPITAPVDRIPDRRPLLAKASAPNLRSYTPPVLSSAPMSPPEMNGAFSASEQKAGNFGGIPPLSPPMSEAEDQTIPPIQPGEYTKPPLSMFSRPLQQYDDSKYAQRQLQAQQGRDSPESRKRNESNSPAPPTRSSSASSNHATFEKPESSFRKTEPTVQEESSRLTFFRDEDAESETTESVMPPLPPPQVVLERPDDHEHPALRKTGAPAHLNLVQDLSNDKKLPSKSTYSIGSPKDAPPEDSPTLGPNSGLSGLVRQHLRNTSTASSIYEPSVSTSFFTSPIHETSTSETVTKQLAIDTSCLDLTEADWDMAHGHTSSIPDSTTEALPLASESSLTTGTSPNPGVVPGREQDDFARHLADGARRVREKLNSYVESDSAPASPMALTPSESSRSLSNALRPNGLGILKSKSSRGSLIDRDRNRDNSNTLQLKPVKVLGLDTLSTSPTSPAMRTIDEPSQDQSSMIEEPRLSEDKDNVHAGLKAFRQARRELQRMKEMEMKQRHQTGPSQASQDSGAPPPRRGTHDRGPPPSSYVRSPSEGPRSRSASRSESRASERDRSGSDTSNGGRSYSRSARLRDGSIPYEDHPAHPGNGFNGLSPNGPSPVGLPPRPNLAPRSPVPPGMENRRSPVSPHPYGGHSPGPYGRQDISPGGKSPGRNIFQVSHDHAESYRSAPVRQGSLPTVHSSPSMHSPAAAPPVPPINPRRKTRHGPLTLETPDEPGVNYQSPISPHTRARSPGPLYMSEEDGAPGDYRRRLRKVTSDNGMRNGRFAGSNASPPHHPPVPPLPLSAGPNPHGFPGGVI